MPSYAALTALQAQRGLPVWFWSADIRMARLRAAIGQSLALGYAHHIQPRSAAASSAGWSAAPPAWPAASR